jgi:hypothetical protein
MTGKLRAALFLACIPLLLAIGPAAASAKSIQLPVVQQIGQKSVLKPNGIAYDSWNDVAYVTSVGPPPRVYLYDTETLAELGHVDLPADADPGSIDWGSDGYLYVIDHAQKRIFRICPECGDVQESRYLAAVHFATGYLDLYEAGPTLLDFGDSFSAGSLWIGAGFETRIDMPDTITPNGGDILNDTGKPKNGWIQDEMLVADANNNHLLRFSDAATPSLLGTIALPGNPGLQPPRDVDVNPLNLNSNVSASAIHQVFVAFPDLGLYESIGPNGPWSQIPATNIGRPTQVASDCETIGATSFSQNQVTFFRQNEPKGSHCEDLVELVLYGGASSGQFKAGLKAFVDANAGVRVIGGAPGEHGQAYEAKKLKKVKLTAGKVSKFKLALPAAIQSRLRSHRTVIFRAKIKLTSPTGQTAKVTRRIRVRAR